MTSAPLLHLRGITRTFSVPGAPPLRILTGVDLDVRPGEHVAVVGRSGTGKSTLLNILGLIDVPTSGGYHLDGVDTADLGESRRAHLRGQTFGFVFQSFNLISFKNAMENVALPLYYQGVPRRQRNAMALDYLERVGLRDWAEHLPSEMSGGQKQRVAIARALIARPQVILADEPTGSLDFATGQEVIAQMFALNQALGSTLVLVTHDIGLARQCQRQLTLQAGRLVPG